MARGGPIELLACAKGGKEYESVITLDCRPSDLQGALITLGLKPGGGPQYQGDPTQPFGDGVLIYVEWEQDGQKKRMRGEELCYNVIDKKSMEPTEWIFIGSKFLKDPETGEDVYMADIEKSIVTVFHDPYTVLDNPLAYGADDTAYVVHPENTPALGAGVKMIFTPAAKK